MSARLTPVAGTEPSDDSDVDEVSESGKIGRVTCVQPRRMGVRRGGDKEVYYARSGLAPRRRDGRGKLSIAGCDVIVDG